MKMRGQMQKGHNQKGFTLVELMVVVVIIGILVAVAVPVYNNVTERAERSAVEANLRTIDGAIMTYYATDPDASTTPLNALSDLGDYLASTPAGPGTATYGITASTNAPNQRATVKGEVGGANITTEVTLEGLPWKK
ncbi:MAG: prepilin-type N-terminal cleavage/methylation domain-containing protein [Syntrophomonadaceae bacterium]